MTEEEFLCTQLVKLYEQYQTKKKLNLSLFYSEKLTALQRTLQITIQKSSHLFNNNNNLDQNVNSSSTLNLNNNNLSEKNEFSLQQIKSLLDEIKTTRQQQEDEENSEFQLLKEIVENWKKVILIRSESPFISSNINLTFIEIEHSAIDDIEIMKNLIETEIEELQLETKIDFLNGLIQEEVEIDFDLARISIMDVSVCFFLKNIIL